MLYRLALRTPPIAALCTPPKYSCVAHLSTDACWLYEHIFIASFDKSLGTCHAELSIANNRLEAVWQVDHKQAATSKVSLASRNSHEQPQFYGLWAVLRCFLFACGGCLGLQGAFVSAFVGLRTVLDDLELTARK